MFLWSRGGAVLLKCRHWPLTQVHVTQASAELTMERRLCLFSHLISGATRTQPAVKGSRCLRAPPTAPNVSLDVSWGRQREPPHPHTLLSSQDFLQSTIHFLLEKFWHTLTRGSRQIHKETFELPVSDRRRGRRTQAHRWSVPPPPLIFVVIFKKEPQKRLQTASSLLLNQVLFGTLCLDL